MIRVCGTLFIDLDGTVLDTGTDNPLPYAVERINAAYDSGWTIILTTLRGDGYKDTMLSREATEMLLDRIGLKYNQILFDSPSPRVIMNDEGAFAINHKRNGSWENYNLTGNPNNQQRVV